MKKVRILLSVLTVFCTLNASKAQEYFGKKIDEAGAIPVSELIAQMKDNEVTQVKVTGKVTEVCQEMGCWMTMDKGDGTTMRVRMKGHSFFVPKDGAGKTAVIEGNAKMKVVTVEQLKHFAEDAGKPAAEIALIKEPVTELTFDAEGVILKD
ncbi:MAG: DUF4920 domain-containing protein [Bacteroidia bacterium]